MIGFFHHFAEKIDPESVSNTSLNDDDHNDEIGPALAGPAESAHKMTLQWKGQLRCLSCVTRPPWQQIKSSDYKPANSAAQCSDKKNLKQIDATRHRSATKWLILPLPGASASTNLESYYTKPLYVDDIYSDLLPVRFSSDHRA